MRVRFLWAGLFGTLVLGVPVRLAPAGPAAATPRPFKASTGYRGAAELAAFHLLAPRHEPSDEGAPDKEPPLLMPRVLVPYDPPNRMERVGALHIRVLRSEIVKADQVLTALAKVTDVEMLIQGEWASRWVVWPRRKYSGREVMDLLAGSFGGQWYTDGRRWVLAVSEVAAELTALSEADYQARFGTAMRRLLQSVTPRQWRHLVEGGVVRFSDLTPAQARLLLDLILVRRYGPGRRSEPPTAAAMRGQGVFLAYRGAGRTATFEIGIPPETRFGQVYVNVPRQYFSFMDQEGKLYFGVPPPR